MNKTTIALSLLCFNCGVYSCEAGFLQNSIGAVKTLPSDFEKKKDMGKKGPSVLDKMVKGRAGVVGTSAESCPRPSTAEEALLRQEKAGLEALIERDQKSLSKVDAALVLSQANAASSSQQAKIAATIASQKQRLLQRISSHKAMLQDLVTKLEGQTGKDESPKPSEESNLSIVSEIKSGIKSGIKSELESELKSGMKSEIAEIKDELAKSLSKLKIS